MSKNKFKAGDRVRLKGNGAIVTVVIAKDGWIAYDENRRIGGACPMEEAEPIDPKTAFLSELKGLLEKYDYIISSGVNFGEDNAEKVFQGISFVSSDESMDIDYDHKYGCITPDDIMDYDKE